MSVGLESVVRGDFVSDFILFSVEPNISSVKPIILKELLTPEEIMEPGECLEPKHVFHLINFVYDFSDILRADQRIKLHDFVQQSFPGLDEFHKTLVSELNPRKKNVIIIDDLTLFSLHCSSERKKLQRFLRNISARPTVKIIGLVQKETLPFEMLSMFCDEADTIAILTGSSGDNSNTFTCNVLRSKSGGKTTSEQGDYAIVKGMIKKVKNESTVSSRGVVNKDDLLTSLTTFKLTLEESEKESKGQLYLPYFEAQRITTVDPFQDDLDDEDEEDEEI